MARLTARNLVGIANIGAVMIVRDETQKRDENGEFPPLLGADGSPSTLTLMGADSTLSRRIGLAQRAKAQNRAFQKAMSKKGSADVTADDVAQQDNEDVEELVASTTAWSGFEDEHDAPLPCAPEHVQALYTNDPSIRAQAQRFVNNRADFLARSTTSSAPSVPTGSA